MIAAVVASATVMAVAQSFKGEPVTVACEGTGFQGEAFVGGNQIWLGELACREANTGQGAGMLTLLHEIGHTTGIEGECEATRFALKQLRPVLRVFYKLTPRQANSRYRDAVSYRRSLPAVYRCAA